MLRSPAGRGRQVAEGGLRGAEAGPAGPRPRGRWRGRPPPARTPLGPGDAPAPSRVLMGADRCAPHLDARQKPPGRGGSRPGIPRPPPREAQSRLPSHAALRPRRGEQAAALHTPPLAVTGPVRPPRPLPPGRPRTRPDVSQGAASGVCVCLGVGGLCVCERGGGPNGLCGGRAGADTLRDLPGPAGGLRPGCEGGSGAA